MDLRRWDNRAMVKILCVLSVRSLPVLSSLSYPPCLPASLSIFLSLSCYNPHSNHLPFTSLFSILSLSLHPTLPRIPTPTPTPTPIYIQVHEPGENWVDGGELRYSKYDDPIPGWVLPGTWLTKDETEEGGKKDGGPRRDGWCRVIYTSTGAGCAPDMNARRHLRRKTLSGLKQLL